MYHTKYKVGDIVKLKPLDVVLNQPECKPFQSIPSSMHKYFGTFITITDISQDGFAYEGTWAYHDDWFEDEPTVKLTF